MKAMEYSAFFLSAEIHVFRMKNRLRRNCRLRLWKERSTENGGGKGARQRDKVLVEVEGVGWK